VVIAERKENGFFPVVGVAATGASVGSGVSWRSSSVGSVEDVAATEGPLPDVVGPLNWALLLTLVGNQRSFSASIEPCMNIDLKCPRNW